MATTAAGNWVPDALTLYSESAWWIRRALSMEEFGFGLMSSDFVQADDPPEFGFPDPPAPSAFTAWLSPPAWSSFDALVLANWLGGSGPNGVDVRLWVDTDGSVDAPVVTDDRGSVRATALVVGVVSGATGPLGLAVTVGGQVFDPDEWPPATFRITAARRS